MIRLWYKISVVINAFAFILLALGGFLNVIDDGYVYVSFGLSLTVGTANSWIAYRETKKWIYLAEAVISALFVGAAMIILLIRSI